MAAKRTYSVRLEEEQRQQLEARAAVIGLPTGHLIRLAIGDYLRQQKEKDYLLEIEMRVVTAVNRLGRQVEKDRAEQQIVMGVLDYLRQWLSFTLPPPVDKVAANELMREREKNFLARLPSHFASGSKSKVMGYMESRTKGAELCPACGTGFLHSKEGVGQVFWYCSNWQESPRCDAKFADAAGHPNFNVVISGDD